MLNDQSDTGPLSNKVALLVQEFHEAGSNLSTTK
jgi:hypothetical protein